MLAQNDDSQSNHSAIKAKLVDLGAYVDDELPDYIMVMVANKKTKAQMTEDLNLFLGTHTDKFTSWLHNLLCKLQSITADIDAVKEDHGEPTKEEIDLLASADKSKKTESTTETTPTAETIKETVDQTKITAVAAKDNSKSQTKDSSGNSKSHSHSKEKDVHKSKGKHSSSTKERKRSHGSESKIEGQKDGNKQQPGDAPQKGSSAAKSPKVAPAGAEEEDEPEIRLRPEHDEFEEEILPVSEKKKTEKSASKSIKVTPQKSADGSRQVKESPSGKKIEDECLEGVVKEALLHAAHEKTARQISPKRSIKRKSSEIHEKPFSNDHPCKASQLGRIIDHPSIVSLLPSSDDHPSVASRLGKKQRSLSSRVGAVIKHDVYDSEDEYDPYKPSIGNVASVVKVTERKSSIPASMQPNKTLLFKAMKDAHKSIETAKEKLTEKTEKYSSEHHRAAVVKPMYRDDPEPRSVRERLGVQRKQTLSSRLSGGSSSSRSIELVSKSSKDNERLFRRRSSENRSRDAHDEERKRKRRSDDSREKRRRLSTEEEYVPTSSSRHGSVEEYTPTPTDSRQVQITVKRKRRDYIEEDILDTLIEGGADDTEFTNTVDVHIETGSQVSSRSSRSEGSADARLKSIHESIHQNDSSEPSNTSPQFVVTLDGVNPELLKKEVGLTLPPKQEPVTKNVVMVKPQRAHVNPVMINLNADDEEPHRVRPLSNTTTGTTPAATSPQKLQEKCRFWPACKAGDQCPYTHPTTECLKFPNCYFGDKCLYLHPACKFDATCSRPDCPYSHTVKKQVATAMPYIVQPVRLYMPRPPPPMQAPAPRAPNPLEQNCRFFPNCTNMNCTFRHPKSCRYGIGCNNKATCYFHHPGLPSKSQLKWAPVTQTSPTGPKAEAKTPPTTT